MKYRTFTVLFVEEYDEVNGVVMDDGQATMELHDSLQSAYDDGYALGSNFLIVGVEDGNNRFWDEWNNRVDTERGRG